MNHLTINNRKVGAGYPVFFIAELSANHLQNLSIALDLVEQAAKAGADAFKIQTLTPDTMTIDCDLDHFVINAGSAWDGRTFYDLYSETPLPYDWHKPIIEKCKECGLICFSTPYDKSSVDFLDQFDLPAYKIASFEIFDIELIRYAASRQKPMIISTGLATFKDMQAAVEACRSVGNEQVSLLKCTSSYPAPYEEIHLKTMLDMEERLDVVVGVSDHTLGSEVALASVALGGSIVEKHVCMDRSLGGPDSTFSIEPEELSALIEQIRNTEMLLGDVEYELSSNSKKNLMFSRSLFFVENLRDGETVKAEHVRSIRPGLGIKPKYLNEIIGRTLTHDVVRGTPVNWEVFE